MSVEPFRPLVARELTLSNLDSNIIGRGVDRVFKFVPRVVAVAVPSLAILRWLACHSVGILVLVVIDEIVRLRLDIFGVKLQVSLEYALDFILGVAPMNAVETLDERVC